MKTTTRDVLIPAVPERTVTQTLYECEHSGCSYNTGHKSEADQHYARVHTIKGVRHLYGDEFLYFEKSEDALAYTRSWGLYISNWDGPGWYRFYDDGDRYHLTFLRHHIQFMEEERDELNQKIADALQLEGEKP